MKSKKEILEDMKTLIVKKGVPDKAVQEEITTGDGRTAYQLVNHHKRLMKVYEQLPTPILWQEYNILKHEIEKKEKEESKDANRQED